MSNNTKQWGAIIVMIALFAMIAFVTNLCSPLAVIVKNSRHQKYPRTVGLWRYGIRSLSRGSTHLRSLHVYA